MCQSVKDWKIASCIFTDWWSEGLRMWLFTCDEKSAPKLSLKLLITSDWLHKRRLMKSLLPLRPPSQGLEELFPRRQAASALRWHETRARDWVSWHGCGAIAGNKSVSLTRRLSSCDVPRCPHRLWANKDVWEGKPEWSQQMSRWKASSVWREAAGLRTPSGSLSTETCLYVPVQQIFNGDSQKLETQNAKLKKRSNAYLSLKWKSI